MRPSFGAVLKACITARAALAELKQATQMIPNQSIQINTLPLFESQASSEIENIVTTTDKLFQHQHENDRADAATKEASRHSQSLYDGFRSIHKKPLNTRTAEEIYTQIKGIHMKVRQTAAKKLKKLAKIGILKEVTPGRERMFVHPELLKLLTRNSNSFPS
ncbi:MAG: Fic family protein [Mariniblastus sp.]